jgi:hypothetical protein
MDNAAVIASASEAIHRATKRKLDGFVAIAPRHDAGDGQHMSNSWTVIPRAGGVSRTPRPLGSITNVSGILDRPVKPGDDDCI